MYTILIFLVTIVLSTLLALPLALASRSSSRPLRLVIGLFSWAGRGTPELIILFFAFFGLSQLGLRIEPMEAVILGFTIFSTAYILEILRGGFEGVTSCQYEAAQALGLSYARTMRRIILPQVFRIIIPPYLTNATMVLKRTSLASVVAVSELTAVSNRLVISSKRPFEVLTLAAIIYIVLNSLILAFQTAVERKWGFAI
jgi:His/Glu/Gln/Arg/opine family amino acid ABC transporter permease subunit